MFFLPRITHSTSHETAIFKTFKFTFSLDNVFFFLFWDKKKNSTKTVGLNKFAITHFLDTNYTQYQALPPHGASAMPSDLRSQSSLAGQNYHSAPT